MSRVVMISNRTLCCVAEDPTHADNVINLITNALMSRNMPACPLIVDF